jgi:hypothetical protein
MKNSSDIIGNQTRDLPACSTVPQPTAPPRITQLMLYSETTAACSESQSEQINKWAELRIFNLKSCGMC